MKIDKYASGPIWYGNMLHTFDWTFVQGNDAESYLSLLYYWYPFIDRFLDKERINGVKTNERIVKTLENLFSRYCTFYTLQPQTDPLIHQLVRTHKRLHGLVKGFTRSRI